MTAKLTLGQFVPADSPIHRLDPRTKILWMLAYIVLIFLVQSLPVFLVPAGLVVIAVLLSGVPARYILTSLKPLRFLIVFMFIINLFLTKGETVLFSWGFLVLTKEGVRQAIYISLRLILLVTGTSILTLTTSPIALTDGLEKLLMPLSKIGFPAHELAMMMTIALRFIPTLMEETERIQKAQLARGANFETGGILQRAKGMIPVLVPLFVSAFRRADELAMAMESRCYHGGKGRTRMRELHFHRGDLIAAFVLILLFALVLVIERVLF